MNVGVPRERKSHEHRVGMTPAGVGALVHRGHDVVVETGAGCGSGITDAAFVAAGARIADSAAEVWATSDLVVKVKEPVAEEYSSLRAGQVIFTYLHLAADAKCADAIATAGATAIAYETVQRPDGSLPLLAPMSEIAGRLAAQVGAYHLMKFPGGSGVLMGGVPGTGPAKVVVIGAGAAGQNAAAMAIGMHADVLVLDTNLDRLAAIDWRYSGLCETRASNDFEIETAVLEADLVIGAVLVAGERAPTLVSNDLVSRMRRGAVLVDVAIDQGGCFEDSRPTTHEDPTYTVHESTFYCVANMPGAVPRTSTSALTNRTFPHVAAIADLGWSEALRRDGSLAMGLNAHAGEFTNPAVARALGRPCRAVSEVLQ